MRRLGVVLPVPEPIAGEVRGLQRALGSHGRLGPHVTLVPPVNADPDSAVAAVRGVAARVPPLRLGVGPAATFWPETPVVYLGVSGDVEALAACRAAVAGGSLARVVTRPFVPHVTVAENVAPAGIDAAVQTLSSFTADVVLDRMHLLQEDATGRWDVLVDAPLGGPRVVGRGGLELSLTAGSELDAESAAFLAWAWRRHREDSYGAGVPSVQPLVVSARREGGVVGVARAELDGELWLDRLVVDVAVRGQGIGAHLLREVEGLARAEGCTRGLLVCQAGAAAEAFYAARGWRVDLRLDRWRRGRDFVRMTRALG